MMSPTLNLRRFVVYVLICLLCVSGLLTITTSQSHASNNSLPRSSLIPTVGQSDEKAADEAAREAYDKRPLSFEENRGQAERHAKYVARGASYALFLSETEAVLALRNDARKATTATDARSSKAPPQQPPARRTVVLRIKLSGAATHSPAVKGESKMAAPANRPRGNDSRKQQTNVARYERVRYSQVYPGVDMIYHGQQRQLEYDFEVAPGADSRRIVVEFASVKRAKVEKGTGELILETSGGEVRQRKPVAYQEVGGVRREIAARYVVLSKNKVRIEAGAYDGKRPLVINAGINYSTYTKAKRQDSGTTSSRTPDQARKAQTVNQPDDYLSISGYVTDEYGYGISGVSVSLDGTVSDYAYTDYDGYYSFDYVEQGGEYYVTPYSSYYTFQPEYEYFYDLQSSAGASFTAVSGSFSISGYVTDEYGYGVSGVFMSLDGSAFDYAYTDYDGYYSFEGLPAGGEYYVTPYPDYYTFQPEYQYFYDLQSDAGGDFTAFSNGGGDSGYSISGYVVDGYGNGIRYADVQVDGAAFDYTSTDEEGFYSFSNLPEGEYTVSAYSGIAILDPSDVTIYLSSDENVTFTTRPASISGSVKTVDGAGVAGVPIHFYDLIGYTDIYATTASDGSYTITNVPTPCDCNLELIPENYNYVFHPPLLYAWYRLVEDQTDIDFSASLRTFAIIGVVRLGSARIPGVKVKLTSPGLPAFTPQTVTTNSGGAYGFYGLRPGRNYTVTPSKLGYQITPVTRTINSLSFNQTAVDFNIINYSVTGRVTRTGKTTGISAVTVTLTSPTPAGFAARTLRTDSNGVYAFTNLPAGRNYTIKPVKSGFTFTPAKRTITGLNRNIPAGATTNFSGSGP